MNTRIVRGSRGNISGCTSGFSLLPQNIVHLRCIRFPRVQRVSLLESGHYYDRLVYHLPLTLDIF
jgi:hypothetical protein